MPKVSVASCTAEFIGTYILTFTVGSNVLAKNPAWGGFSIACSLMVCIYALGKASGAHFNPAVTLGLAVAEKLEDGWVQVAAYISVQIVAGIAGALSYFTMYGDYFDLGPTPGFSWWQAMLCEMFYTFMLVFVVLNTAASKKIGGKNQFYGLAIGFVIVAGAYGPGAVSGGCFNPAVAIGIDTSSFGHGFGWCGVYIFYQIIGSMLAVAAFQLMRPEESGEGGVPPSDYKLSSKLIGEGLGTYMLVLTAGLNVLVESKASAFSIAACLMCMIYAIGDVSGAHFNPAVTAAIWASGRGKMDGNTAVSYMFTQVISGMLGAMTYAVAMSGVTFPIGPGLGYSWWEVASAEVLFTGLLSYIVLCVATADVAPAKELTGFIIGMCITVGGLAIGEISGGSLNPAVSFGVASARIFFGGTFYRGAIYMVLEVLGGLVAAGVFRLTYPDEYMASLAK